MGYENVCGKLREARMLSTVLGIVAMVIGVICLVVGTGNDMFLVVAAIGSISSALLLLGYAVLFATFAQLVDDVHAIREKVK